MIILGLTGSIGMGKSTAAALFAAQAIPVYSADAVVHALYEREDVIDLIADAFADVITSSERRMIDRAALSQHLVKNPACVKKLEMIVHPLLHTCEKDFLQQAQKEKHPLVVLDIPLLYETGAEDHVDYVAVVSAPEHLQRQRVLARENMDEEKFAFLLARQMPDSEKRKRADFIINTGEGIEKTKSDVKTLINRLVGNI